MTARCLLLPLAVALSTLVSPPVGANGPGLPAGAEGTARTLSVQLRCEACQGGEALTLGLLWRAEPGQEPARASVETIDWLAGTFRLSASDRDETLTLRGEPLPDANGWQLEIPLGTDLPFRVMATLQGYSPSRAAWFPEREESPVIVLTPIAEVLDAQPEWDPRRTGECEILVPKATPSPVTFFVEGQPRAWLYEAAPGADGTAQWTFQFVRPGEGLLERVSVLVPALDEADTWVFRLPLQAVLGDGAAWPAVEGGGSAQPSGDVEPVNEVRVGGVGTILLQDCPRATR